MSIVGKYVFFSVRSLGMLAFRTIWEVKQVFGTFDFALSVFSSTGYFVFGFWSLVFCLWSFVSGLWALVSYSANDGAVLFFTGTTTRNARLSLPALHLAFNCKSDRADLFFIVTTATNARLSLLVLHVTFNCNSSGAVLFSMVTTTTNAGFSLAVCQQRLV